MTAFNTFSTSVMKLGELKERVTMVTISIILPKGSEMGHGGLGQGSRHHLGDVVK